MNSRRLIRSPLGVARFLVRGCRLRLGSFNQRDGISNSQGRAGTPAAIAGVMRNVLCVRTKLLYVVNSASEWTWFSTSFEKAFVSGVSGALVRFWRSADDLEICAGSGDPSTGRRRPAPDARTLFGTAARLHERIAELLRPQVSAHGDEICLKHRARIRTGK